jgi:hypothetical protein
LGAAHWLVFFANRTAVSTSGKEGNTAAATREAKGAAV